MEYLGFTVSGGKISVTTKKVQIFKYCPFPTTQRKIRSFVQFCNLYGKPIHHFYRYYGSITGLLRKSKPHKVTMTPACS
jgi:hypothetical protein